MTAWHLGWKSWAWNQASKWARLENAKREHAFMLEYEIGYLARRRERYADFCENREGYRESAEGQREERELRRLAWDIDCASQQRFELPEDLPKATVKRLK